jgi:stringent starvation protein B
MNPDERPSKRDAFLAFLAEGWVSLHLDARRTGVEVPPAFAGHAHLVLQYGRDMPIPIPDLEVTEAGVTATLSFSRAPHRTYVPWAAVYVVGCTDGRAFIYAEDVPEGVSLFTAPAAETPDGATTVDARPRLKSIPAPSDDLAELADVPSKRRKRPQLRLVK